jgi:molecular chaperone HtpG
VGSRVLSELESFADRDSAGYEALFETFGSVLKEGLYEDFERRDQLLGLARFRSSKGDGWRSLEHYCEALRPNQTEIYYLTGDNLDRLKASPQLEAAASRGIEVLLMTDPVDSFWVTSRPDYKGKPFKSLSQGDVDLGLVPLLDTAAPVSQASGTSAGLAARIKACLGDAVSDVVVSKRLVTSAVCLVAPGQGPDLSLDKLLARQDRAFGVKPILEINADHPLLAALTAQVDASAQIGGESAGDGAVAEPSSVLADVARLLFDQARILDGDAPVDAALFAQTLNRLVLKGLG